MGGRFLGLRLDVELTPETDLVLVLDRQVQETGQVVEPLHVGIEEGRIALRPPEDIPFSPSAWVTSIALQTWAAAWHRLDQQLVAPCMYLGWMKRQAVPQSRLYRYGTAPRGFSTTASGAAALIDPEPSVRHHDREAVAIYSALLEELEECLDPGARVDDRIGSIVPGGATVPTPNGSARGFRMVCQ